MAPRGAYGNCYLVQEIETRKEAAVKRSWRIVTWWKKRTTSCGVKRAMLRSTAPSSSGSVLWMGDGSSYFFLKKYMRCLSFDLEMWTGDMDATLAVGDVDASLMIETVNVCLSPALLSAPDLFVRVNQNDGTFFSEDFEGEGGAPLLVKV